MLIFLPICGTLVLCTKLLTLIPYDTVTNIFSETEWSEFFINSNVSNIIIIKFISQHNVYKKKIRLPEIYTKLFIII